MEESRTCTAASRTTDRLQRVDLLKLLPGHREDESRWLATVCAVERMGTGGNGVGRWADGSILVNKKLSNWVFATRKLIGAPQSREWSLNVTVRSY